MAAGTHRALTDPLFLLPCPQEAVSTFAWSSIVVISQSPPCPGVAVGSDSGVLDAGKGFTGKEGSWQNVGDVMSGKEGPQIPPPAATGLTPEHIHSSNLG